MVRLTDTQRRMAELAGNRSLEAQAELAELRAADPSGWFLVGQYLEGYVTPEERGMVRIKLEVSHRSGLDTGGYPTTIVELHVNGRCIGSTKAVSYPGLRPGAHGGWEVRDSNVPWAGGSVFGKLLPALRHIIRNPRILVKRS